MDLFKDLILSSVIYPWWLRHGAMEPLEATPLRVTVDELDIGIDTFKLVIRLSSAKQLAFPFCTIFVMSRWSYGPREPCGMHPYLRKAVRDSQKPCFFAAAQAFETTHDHEGCCRQAHAFQVWSFLLLMVFWWGWTYRAPNSLELEQLFMPFGAAWLRSRRRVTHDTCCSWNWVLFRLIVLFVSRPSPTSPHSVPNSSPVLLRNVSWGLGVCSVFVRSVSPRRLSLEVRSFPSPPALFWPFARRLCPLFPSSCLSGLTRLRPGVCVCVTSK